jgi:hypothetical protein
MDWANAESSIFTGAGAASLAAGPDKFNSLFANSMTASMSVPELSVPALPAATGAMTMTKDKSAPNLQPPSKGKGKVKGQKAGGRSSPNAGGVPNLIGGGAADSDEETPRPVLPMLVRNNKRSILDDDREEMAAIAEARRKEAELAEKQRQIVEGEISVDEVEAMELADSLGGGGEEGEDERGGEEKEQEHKKKSKDGSESARTVDSVRDWLENFRVSKRLDIAGSTGFKKPPQKKIGMISSMRSATPGGTQKKIVGEAPRKRLAATLQEYKKSSNNNTFRKQMLLDLSEKNALARKMEGEVMRKREAEAKSGKAVDVVQVLSGGGLW